MRVGLKACTPRRNVYGELDRELGLPTDRMIRKIATERERARCHQISRRQKPGEPPREPREDDIAIRELGLKGEREVARSLHVPMRYETFEHSGDKRANLISIGGVPIDVVTRTPLGAGLCEDKRVPDLILRVAEKARDDLALVLVVWLGDHIAPLLFGWLWEVELRRLDHRETFRNAENFVATPLQLRPFETLKYATPDHVPGAPSAQVTMFDSSDLFGGESRGWAGKL